MLARLAHAQLGRNASLGRRSAEAPRTVKRIELVAAAVDDQHLPFTELTDEVERIGAHQVLSAAQVPAHRDRHQCLVTEWQAIAAQCAYDRRSETVVGRIEDQRINS